MRVTASILMLAILLQPFNAIAAAGTMATLADAPMLADGEHCEDHGDPAVSLDAAADPAVPTEHECLDECQVCASVAGAFLLSPDTASSGNADTGYLILSSQPFADAFSDLLYRPPIRS